jgi:hypothetical protein
MIAECAVANNVAEILETRAFDAEAFWGAIRKAKTEWIGDERRLLTLMHKSADATVRAIQSVPEGDLGLEIAMPWGPVTVAQMISYPYWNMSYHEGQINYIASMLGCLG